jgi:hypothetical protein
VVLSSNQDIRQAKNRKRGDAIQGLFHQNLVLIEQMV